MWALQGGAQIVERLCRLSIISRSHRCCRRRRGPVCLERRRQCCNLLHYIRAASRTGKTRQQLNPVGGCPEHVNLVRTELFFSAMNGPSGRLRDNKLQLLLARCHLRALQFLLFCQRRMCTSISIAFSDKRGLTLGSSMKIIHKVASPCALAMILDISSTSYAHRRC